MHSFVMKIILALVGALMLLTINVVPGTEAGNHGHGHGVASILASGLVIELLRGQGRRRRSLDVDHHGESIQ